MVGFWSSAIALSDFDNVLFFELSGLSQTTMSPGIFLYLVKKFKKLWSKFGRDWYYERILKIFGFLKSAPQAIQQCPKPLFSISSKNFKKYGRIWVESDSMSGF